MFLIYLITCFILIVITKRLTNKNYKEIKEMQNYLDICNEVSMKFERIEKRNIKAINKLWIINKKNESHGIFVFPNERNSNECMHSSEINVASGKTNMEGDRLLENKQ